MRSPFENDNADVPLSQRSEDSMSVHKIFINGEWVQSHSKSTLDVLNPATGERIAELFSYLPEEELVRQNSSHCHLRRGHFFQIVPGAEGRPLGGEHDDADGFHRKG